MTTSDILTTLLEMAYPNYTVPDSQKIRQFWVDYYAVTPKGSRARFQRGEGLTVLKWGRSETAVLSWLKQKHPGCDIQIMGLKWQ